MLNYLNNNLLLEDISLKIQDELDVLNNITNKGNFAKIKMIKVLKRIIEILSDKEDSVIDLELQKIKSFKEFTQNKDNLVKVTDKTPTPMEEKRAKDPNFDTSSINNVKASLMGPLSGIGDSIFLGTLRIIAAGIGASLCMNGNPFGAILFLLL